MAKQLIRDDQLRGGGGGALQIRDISTTDPGGSATNKVWHDPPNNTILDEVQVSDLAIDVSIRSFHPNVEVDGNPFTLAKQANGEYEGVVSVVMAAAGDLVVQGLTPDGTPGGKDTCVVSLAEPPAVLSAVWVNPYPGVQTELNADQTAQLRVQSVGGQLFNRIVVANFEAGEGENIDVADTNDVTVPVKIAARGAGIIPGQAVRVQLRDATTLALGPTYDSDAAGVVDGVNVVTLNNDSMGPALSSITYPIGQTAVKGIEQATVNHTLADLAGDVLYTFPTGQLSSLLPNNVFNGAYVVDCTNPGVYNGATTNFRLTTTKTSNGKVAILNVVVVVADVAPTITKAHATRLRSGGNDGTAVQDVLITLTSSQPLAAAPTLNEDSGGNRGTFQGAWSGGPSIWTRLLRVDETIPDEKGVFNFLGLVATGLAGLIQNVISGGSAYTLGGFVVRSLTVTPFANGADINTSVEDFNKLIAVDIPELGLDLVKQPIGTPVQPDTPANESKRGWYTIDATGINPTRLLLLHQGTIDGNAAGMTITGVQETV